MRIRRIRIHVKLSHGKTQLVFWIYDDSFCEGRKGILFALKRAVRIADMVNVDIGGEIRLPEDFGDAHKDCFLSVQIHETLIDTLPAFGLRKLDKLSEQYGGRPIVF